MKLPPELSITPKDWEKTLLSVLAVVVMLWEENQLLKARVAHLQKQVGKLESELARLQERVNMTSQNSSKHLEELAANEQTNATGEEGIEKKKVWTSTTRWEGTKTEATGSGLPGGTQLAECMSVHSYGDAFDGEDPQPERHQVSELPKIEPEIIEYQRHMLTCE